MGENNGNSGTNLEITYWLENVTDINTKIEDCSKYASNLLEIIKKMNTCIQKNVNCPGSGWNDANSIQFAKWWNAGAGPKLEINADKDFSVDAYANAALDGGSLKLILNKCAKLYWLVICNPLYIVTTGKYAAKRKLFKPNVEKMYNLGNKELYINTPIIKDNVWMELMAEIIGIDKPLNWENLKISEEISGSSSTEKLANFIKEFTNYIKMFTENLQKYINSINVFLNDNQQKELFGLTPNENMKKAANDLIYFSNTAIKTIGGEIQAMLFKYIGIVDNNVKKYFDTNYFII